MYNIFKYIYTYFVCDQMRNEIFTAFALRDHPMANRLITNCNSGILTNFNDN